ncbi:MAG TPA: hypothetical protein VGF48_05165 [Thermoanaerobaculia bacterium]|jgi:hypothetical protein
MSILKTIVKWGIEEILEDIEAPTIVRFTAEVVTDILFDDDDD